MSPDLAGYIGPERRKNLERRETVGTVVAYRAVYDRSMMAASSDGTSADQARRRTGEAA